MLIGVVACVITSLFTFNFNKYAMGPILNSVSYDMKKSSIQVLRNTGLNDINDLLSNHELYQVHRNKENEIDGIDFNVPVLNNALIIIAKNVRKKLFNQEKKNSIYYVPMGLATNNGILATTGTKIPVKVDYKGNVGLDLKTRVKPYGIDSALIEIFVRIEVEQTIIYPFSNRSQKIVSDVPVVIKIVRGTTNNVVLDKNISYSLPID